MKNPKPLLIEIYGGSYMLEMSSAQTITMKLIGDQTIDQEMNSYQIDMLISALNYMKSSLLWKIELHDSKMED